MGRESLRNYLLIITIIPFFSKAQDTVTIREIRITTTIIKQSLLRTTEAAAVIDSNQLKLQSSLSLVTAMNAIPGVRMEERSPGSYRLSIRGSLLRSPFGIRNVKIYLDEYPLTDAGGNTYLNVLDVGNIDHIDILKGPDGSLFGANSGGVITLHSSVFKNKFIAETCGGSYGLFKQNISVAKKINKHLLFVSGNYQRSDGYRQNSRLHRLFLQANDKWQYSKYNSIKALVFYSDLFYQTPGGLNQVQFDTDPSQARPATAILPGAVTQKAAVYNKMIFAGITHNTAITDHMENVTALFASSVNFKNPFITNFETRKENTYGARTFFLFSNHSKLAFFNSKPFIAKYEYVIGAEWQQTRSDISNYTNDRGNKGLLTASGNILSDQHFIFNRLKIDLGKKVLIEAGLSLNYYSYRFKDSSKLYNKFKPQWMPRFAFCYSPTNKIALRFTLSRGYSPPTTAEIRPSDNNIYKGLQPETGTNAEFGARYFAFANKLQIDLSFYNYELRNAIVQQQNTNGETFFVNAGGTRQKGMELFLSYMIISPSSNNHCFKKIRLSNSSSLNDFHFRHYVTGTTDHSGKNITGVPKQNLVSSLLMELKCQAYVFIQYNYTSKIPLNDANSFFANPYRLLQTKAGYSFSIRSSKIELYAGADNLLDQQYSLGNDLNAAGNRFFNAAPGRNYFAGIILSK